MVGSKHPQRGTKISLNPKTAAALSALPPLGYKVPPTLIDFKTVDTSVISRRIKNYNRAYKTLSVTSWNTYVSFGIQDFEGPDDYYIHCANESSDARHLRLARYYRKHLEAKAKIDGFLMQSISAIKTSLSRSYPGFFDMSLGDMDSYCEQLKAQGNNTHDEQEMEITPENETPNEPNDQSAPSSLALAATATSNSKSSFDPSDEPANTSVEFSQSSVPPLTQATDTVSCSPARRGLQASQTQTRRSDDTTTTQSLTTDSAPPCMDASNTNIFPNPGVNKQAKKVSNVIRIEARWAPKDFNELRVSTKKLHLRLAPILSCFNTDHSWMLEWQTNQMDDLPDIEPTQLAKYLSIRVVSVAKEQCFYFSFRINATGAGFSQVAASKVLTIAKRGENLTFDPSCIPANQGELLYVGDILLKDASITHRGQYLQYLRKEVLPPDTPAFDIKLRHSNPTGSRITILTIRCGKPHATSVAEILRTALCGDADHPEIFISRLALGANQTSKTDHKKIYDVHNAFVHDVSHLLFSASTSIDTPVTEYYDNGGTVTRSPRQWAKSLVYPAGESLEADLENGGQYNGKAVLVVPSAALLTAKTELQKYWDRRNPTLSHASKLYQDSLSTHPDIPKTVFTKNIDTILSKKIRARNESTSIDDSSSTFSPAISSLSGEATLATAPEASNKPTIAWRKPLQETLLLTKVGNNLKSHAKSMSSVELNQLKHIAILEAQLALHSGTESLGSKESHKSSKSKTSRSSSQSGLTAASAHSRLDKFDESLQEIKALLTKLTIPSTTSNSPPSTPPPDLSLQQAPASPRSDNNGMLGVLLFPEDSSQCTSLALLKTPPRKENPSKRRKQATTPTQSPISNLRLQNNEHMGSGGRKKC